MDHLRRYVLAAALCAGALGCSAFAQRSTAGRFAAGLEAGDLSAVAELSTDDFNRQVWLRMDAGVLSALGLEAAEPEVLETEITEEATRVTVDLGSQRATFVLVAADDGRWLVDDIVLETGGEARHLKDEIALYLAARDFMTAWSMGQPELRSLCAPELSAAVESLPSSALVAVAAAWGADALAAGLPAPSSIERIGDQATLRLEREGRQIAVVFRQQASFDAGMAATWVVEDVVADLPGRDRRTGEAQRGASLREHLEAGAAFWAFTAALAARDERRLEQLATPALLHRALRFVDTVEPDWPSMSAEEVAGAHWPEILVNGTGASIVLDQGSRALWADLDRDASGRLRIEELSLYTGSDRRTLTAAITTQVSVNMFLEGLELGDIQMLMLSSTADFNERVWSRIGPELLGEAASMAGPLDAGAASSPPVRVVRYYSTSTEVSLVRGGRAMTLRLVEDTSGAGLTAGTGGMRVDDVLIPAGDRPSSLKSVLAMLIPVRGFIDGLQTADRAAILGNASRNFTALVWQRGPSVPEIARQLGAELDLPLAAIEVDGDTAVIRTGEGERGGLLRVIVEDDQYRVDDASVYVRGELVSLRTLLGY